MESKWDFFFLHQEHGLGQHTLRKKERKKKLHIAVLGKTIEYGVAVLEIVLINAIHSTLLQSCCSMFCSGHGENEGQAGMKGGGGANLRGGAGQEGEFMNTDLRIGKE